MDVTYAQVCSWENLRLAYDKAARGKRGKPAAAAFEFGLADNLLDRGRLADAIRGRQSPSVRSSVRGVGRERRAHEAPTPLPFRFR